MSMPESPSSMEITSGTTSPVPLIAGPFGSASTSVSPLLAVSGQELTQLRRLYPYVSIDDLPLRWSPKDKAQHITLSDNNLKVHYKGIGKNHKDAASVRATHPIQTSCLLYYFEIKIISKGRDGYMGVGLAAGSVSMNRLPGWDKLSYGYHGDDGHSFCSSGTGQPYGPTFTTGDVIGCAYNLIERTCFYTKNGTHLGIAFSDLPADLPLYPTVGLQTPGEEVEANFGLEPFMYNIEDDLAALRARVTRSITDFNPTRVAPDYCAAIHSLVQQWLIHNGYCDTAKVFSDSTRLKFSENMARMKNRLDIQKLVLSGRIGQAIELTNQLYPDVLKSDHNLHFALLCRQFVELVAGNELAANDLSSPSQETYSSHINGDSCNGSGTPAMEVDQIQSNDDEDDGPIVDGLLIENTSARRTENSDPVMNERNNKGKGIHSNASVIGPSSDKNLLNKLDLAPQQSNTANGKHANGVANGTCTLDASSATTPTSTLTSSSETHDLRMTQVVDLGRKLFAHSQDLYRKHGHNEANSAMLENAFSLVAYSDPASSPVGWQLAPSEREGVCQALNNALVRSEANGKTQPPALELLVRHTKSLVKLNHRQGAWLVDHL